VSLKNVNGVPEKGRDARAGTPKRPHPRRNHLGGPVPVFRPFSAVRKGVSPEARRLVEFAPSGVVEAPSPASGVSRSSSSGVRGGTAERGPRRRGAAGSGPLRADPEGAPHAPDRREGAIPSGAGRSRWQRWRYRTPHYASAMVRPSADGTLRPPIPIWGCA